MNVFLNRARELRNGWWIAVFFLVMASTLVPLLIVARRLDAGVPLVGQLAVVAMTSVFCQRLRGRPFAELSGAFDRTAGLDLLAGCLVGAGIMLVPAAGLMAAGVVRWSWSGAGLAGIITGIGVCAGTAATEELLFRGFPFQRLVDGAGSTVAQIVVAAYFVLTHSSAIAMAGEVRFLAAANIFVASLLFGVAFLRTKGLALPFGLHFGANLTQGTILGFGVSGRSQPRILVPHAEGPAWLTGGTFGLEASVGGFVIILVAWLVLRSGGLRGPASQRSNEKRLKGAGPARRREV